MCSNSFFANFCSSSTSVFIYCNTMLQVTAQIVFNFTSLNISYVISRSVPNILYIFITAITYIYVRTHFLSDDPFL
jgi:hypothetical protein